MATYIALVRGINVGRNVLKMERLRALWAALGFTEVRTYIQSGNVVFEAADAPSKQAARIESSLEGETRLPVSVILRTPADLKRLVAKNPFLKQKGVDPSKLHVSFLADKPTKEGLKRLAAIDAGADQYQVAGQEIYLHCPNGYGKSKLANSALERALGVRATTRNWRTVETLLAMATQ